MFLMKAAIFIVAAANISNNFVIGATEPGGSTKHRAMASVEKPIRPRADTSKRIKQLKFHESLISPLPEGSGIDNDLRLAKNAVRLGIATEELWKLLYTVDTENIERIIEEFDHGAIFPSEDSRKAGVMDPLPFLHSPGVMAGLLQGSQAHDWIGLDDNDIPDSQQARRYKEKDENTAPIDTQDEGVPYKVDKLDLKKPSDKVGPTTVNNEGHKSNEPITLGWFESIDMYHCFSVLVASFLFHFMTSILLESLDRTHTRGEKTVRSRLKNHPKQDSTFILKMFLRTPTLLFCAIVLLAVSSTARMHDPTALHEPSAPVDPGTSSWLVEREEINSGIHLRGMDKFEQLTSQRNDHDNGNEVALSHLNNDLMEIFSKINEDDDDENGPDALKASARVLALVKDRISDPQVEKLFPSSFQPMFKSLVRELDRAENHVKKVEQYASEYYLSSGPQSSLNAISDGSRRRLLSTSHRQRFSPGTSRADYHIRARKRHMQGHHSLGERFFEHQQGYHGARKEREEGAMRRRLSDHDNCVDPDPVERKTEQCDRLANCAQNYNIYDLFVFIFGDDIDFDTGRVDSKEKIKAEDEIDLIQKLDRIKSSSSDILVSAYNETKCDELLQEFHRFDEELSVKGKWQGGSVTGVCRGWGTSRFMSLESIYHISDAVLSVKERVEDCIEDLVDEFNRELENFTSPEFPCVDDFEDPVTGSNVTFYSGLTVDDVVADIKEKFDCLYYSFLTQTGGNCTAAPECDSTACADMLFNPVFAARDRWGIGFFNYIFSLPSLFGLEVDEEGPYFEYDIPAVLPSREDRLKKNSFGPFLVDYAPVQDLTAERFIIEVFDEYLGCASDIVKSLINVAPERPIFSFNDTLYNPYAPDQDNQTQFQLPLTIDDSFTDKHGQLQSEFLDQIFRYVEVGDISEGEVLEDTTLTPGLSEALKTFMAEAYYFDQLIDELIAYFEDRDCSYCDAIVNLLKPLRDRFFNQGLDRSSLDTSIALVFGNKTTIGQVCSFARGLEDGAVDDLPGFCCLDAPYQAFDWGEKFSCEKYVNLTDGSTKVVQKSTEDCARLGPITSGFNEAACDIFHGTWCPTPRNCTALVTCINDAKDEVQENRDRQAFFEYLDEATEVEDPSDVKACGELREYFEYDRDYPDDDRICEEVLDLQCFTDFSNLDGYATGTAGPGSESGLAELAVSEDVKLITKTPFDKDAGKAWKISNSVIKAAIEVVEFILDLTKGTQTLCTISISCIPGTSAACQVPATTIKFSFDGVKKILKKAVEVSEKIYGFVVDGQNAAFEADRQNSMYTNIITNHGNIITTFYATQQLKVMLGEISDGIAKNNEEERRRMICVRRPTRICDGSFNFPYVASLKGAGCDNLDSDGDSFKDFCEDRWPPEIVVRDAVLFRCDESDTSRLCHDGTVFNREQLALNFLEYQFPATDDCSATDKLSVNITKVDGECRNTIFELLPVQDIPECQDHGPVIAGIFSINYTNPLPGFSRRVSVALDEDPPVIECGFIPDDTSINVIDNKTLYHYMLKTDGDGLGLSDARFWYNVTDNCDDDVSVNVVVKSNEVQQNNIAGVFEYQAGNSNKQASVFYAATTCENVGAGLLCIPSPLPLVQKVRFYDIIVTATDSAGNIGNDKCTVVIVSSCSPPFSGCEKYNTKGNPNAENFYYERSYVEDAVATQNQTLFKVAEGNLVWEAD